MHGACPGSFLITLPLLSRPVHATASSSVNCSTGLEQALADIEQITRPLSMSLFGVIIGPTFVLVPFVSELNELNELDELDAAELDKSILLSSCAITSFQIYHPEANNEKLMKHSTTHQFMCFFFLPFIPRLCLLCLRRVALVEFPCIYRQLVVGRA
jgi:hypothetical protein